MFVIYPCQIWYANVKAKEKNTGQTRRHVKNYKFDLEVKYQRCIRTMNVRDTLSHCDTPMCQIWLQCLRQKKDNARTRICTHRETNRQSEFYILLTPFHPKHFCIKSMFPKLALLQRTLKMGPCQSTLTKSTLKKTY